MTNEIPGYTAGARTLPRSPISLEAFATMQKSVLFDDQDVRALRESYDVVKDQVEAILDVWYGFVGSQPHLLASFAHRDSGAPLSDYLSAVRRRFGQWILDTARADYDQAWLDYQHEIALRHHATKKGSTDQVATSSREVPLRYLIAFVVPITATIRPFLERGARDGAELDAMHQAWFKAVTLSVALWSQPYAPTWW